MTGIRLRGLRLPKAGVEFTRWLEDQIDIRHRVDVHITSRLWGYFDAPGRYTGFDPYAVVSMDRDPLLTIAHEMVHYEQWRDKREGTERGVEQRAEALVRRWRRG